MMFEIRELYGQKEIKGSGPNSKSNGRPAAQRHHVLVLYYPVKNPSSPVLLFLLHEVVVQIPLVNDPPGLELGSFNGIGSL